MPQRADKVNEGKKQADTRESPEQIIDKKQRPERRESHEKKKSSSKTGGS